MSRTRSRALPLALLALTACSPRHATSPNQGELDAVFSARSAAFSCRAPGRWRLIERQGGSHEVSFLGPPEGPAAFSVSLSLYYHPRTSRDFPSLERYVLAHTSAAERFGPLLRWPWRGGFAASFNTWGTETSLHSLRTESRQETTILLPRGGGFYAWVLSAPESRANDLQPLLRSVVDSFELRD